MYESKFSTLPTSRLTMQSISVVTTEHVVRSNPYQNLPFYTMHKVRLFRNFLRQRILTKCAFYIIKLGKSRKNSSIFASCSIPQCPNRPGITLSLFNLRLGGQRMKAFFLRTYVSFGIGAFFAHHKFVVVTGGLYVEVVTSSGSACASNFFPDEMYTVRLQSTDLAGVLGKLQLGYIIERFPNPRSEFVDPEQSPKGPTDRSENSFRSAKELRVEVKNQWCATHWELDGDALNKWITNNILNSDGKEWYMSIQAYVTENPGIYAITPDSMRLKSDEVSSGKNVFMLMGPHKADISYLGKEYNEEKVSINLDYEGVGIPHSHCEYLKEALRTPRGAASSAEKNVFMIITFQGKAIKFYLHKIDCTSYSQDGAWTVGFLILQTYSVIIDSTGGNTRLSLKEK